MSRSLAWPLLLLVWMTIPGVLCAQDGPPAELKSPDQHYAVKIVSKPDSATDSYNDSDLAVYRGSKEVSKFGTIGYLDDAKWSPHDEYVAVNNRRANSGDYLWVFRLRDGFALKKPVDAEPSDSDEPYMKFARKLVGYVTAKYPQETFDNFRKEFTFATGWTADGKLTVENEVQFNHSDRVVRLVETFAVKADKLVLVSRKITDRPRGDKEF